jgi:hypothetical protein
LEYYLKEKIENNNEVEEKIINMLSEPLKKKLLLESNKIALKDSKIFKENFTDRVIEKTIPLIKEIRLQYFMKNI